MNTRKFSNRRLAGEVRTFLMFVVCSVSLLSSAGCALNRTQSAGELIMREEKLARIESLSQITRTLQHQLAELQGQSEARLQELTLAMEFSRRDSAEAEKEVERLENDLSAERGRLAEERRRLSEERDKHREEIAELNERIAALESSKENLLSQISVIRARHQTETVRLKKEIERLSDDGN